MRKTKAQLEQELDDCRRMSKQYRMLNVEHEYQITRLKDELNAANALLALRAKLIQDHEMTIDQLQSIRDMAFGEEPPQLSIVMDNEGCAWQRFSSPADGWYLAAAASESEPGNAVPWNEMNLRYGPVTLLNRGRD